MNGCDWRRNVILHCMEGLTMPGSIREAEPAWRKSTGTAARRWGGKVEGRVKEGGAAMARGGRGELVADIVLWRQETLCSFLSITVCQPSRPILYFFSHSLSLALHSFGHCVPSQRCLGPPVVSTRHHLFPVVTTAAAPTAAIATTRLYSTISS